MRWDAVVIGAGVVGLACAERLARGGRSVLLIERHRSFGQETSSRSSQVVHAGLYYPEGSWKARLCVEGRRLLSAWCARHDVPLRAIGKLIVATTEDELDPLSALEARAIANGVHDLERWSAAQVSAREPDVIARGALWSPSSGIVDAHALMASLLASARDQGCDVAWRHRVVRAERSHGEYVLQVDDERGVTSAVRAGVVINSAGLAADDVAAMIGIDVDAADYRQRWVKGRYCRLRRGPVVRSLVYPVPPRGLAGLGVHLTLELDGAMRLGPDVEWLAERRVDHTVPEEIVPRFYEAVSRYLRRVSIDEIVVDQAGIRPKRAGAEGEVRDFVIAEESARGLPGWVSLIGIESPGLTASLAIADEVARQVA